jgi:hypothetical protein
MIRKVTVAKVFPGASTMTPRAWGARRADCERGVANIGLLATVSIGVIALVFWALVPLLSATDQAQRADTMAESAALAGAQEIRTQALELVGNVSDGQIVGGDLWRQWTLVIPLKEVREHAAHYAGANGGKVLDLVADLSTSTVTVRAHLLEKAPTGDDGDHARSSAAASLGYDLTGCTVTAQREQGPPRKVDPDDEDSEMVPGDYTPWQFTFVCDDFSGGPSENFGSLRDQAHDYLADKLTAHLVN